MGVGLDDDDLFENMNRARRPSDDDESDEPEGGEDGEFRTIEDVASG